MSLSRREFLHTLAIAGAAGLLPRGGAGAQSDFGLYEFPPFGNARILHFTDSHAQLQPIYFREPHVNLGFHAARGVLPHIVGTELAKSLPFPRTAAETHAFTYLDFDEAARRYGKVGGFAYLATLVKQLRQQAGPGNSLLIDGGDTWQGSGTAYWTRGADMVGATNLLGVDVMTGHWEFTYRDEEILKNIEAFDGDFVAQNVRATEDALFEGTHVHDEDTGHVFPPYTVKTVGGARFAVIGQAFPYTPIANPSRFIPDWTFGIQDEAMQNLVDQVREQEKPDAVIVLSHNGMDVDLKMASIVRGIDAVFGGHTHDGVPAAVPVSNAGGVTLVTNAGSNGKFLGVMDFDIRGGRVRDYRYRLVPIFSNYLKPDPVMSAYISRVRAPYYDRLHERLAVTDETLYRRGNFNGTFDQVICDALRAVNDAQIALSPGFRWGTSVLAGAAITRENVLDQTCITYPETYRREMTGADLKLILEDVCDNLFNPDPYYQQGGDMVRVGGMDYVCDPTESIGKRISGMRLDDGTPIDAGRKYIVAGWATVNSQAPGAHIWDQVTEYLKAESVVRIRKLNTPMLKNVGDNPGLADYRRT